MTGQKKERVETVLVGVRLTPVQVELIEKLVESGYAKSKSDFCYQAVVNQLKELGLFTDLMN